MNDIVDWTHPSIEEKEFIERACFETAFNALDGIETILDRDDVREGVRILVRALHAVYKVDRAQPEVPNKHRVWISHLDIVASALAAQISGHSEAADCSTYSIASNPFLAFGKVAIICKTLSDLECLSDLEFYGDAVGDEELAIVEGIILKVEDEE